MKYRVLALATLTCGLVASAVNANVYNFFDTTFNNADWSGAKHADTTPGALATFGAFQLPVGGSPLTPGPQTPDYRSIRHIYDNGAIVVSHQGTNYNWAPLPLEVATTVDYSYDLKFFEGPAGAVGFKPAIFQGGNVYVPLGSDDIFGTPPPSAWTRFSASAVPVAAFGELSPVTGLVNPISVPNATAAMSFGFTSANSAGAGGPFSKISGIDDFQFTLNTIVLPEPTTLMALAIAAPLARRRRRS